MRFTVFCNLFSIVDVSGNITKIIVFEKPY
jgi:hypothetical protein